ncbi:3654_t:CDS:2 [Diversispora eburnea]|uniref:3654_t:CDS:1 n=1 Tax=Diversispora eburnea TaxID=1213867 RepID=A0A9N8WMW0_9GLOM|nr:3654_t:CDS:2 [Diversispora eburnea]
MDPYKDYYMDPEFDPRKANMSRLREILLENSVGYTGAERKADLVEKFELEIRPKIPALQKRDRDLEIYKQKTVAQLERTAEKKKLQFGELPKLSSTKSGQIARGRRKGKEKEKTTDYVTTTPVQVPPNHSAVETPISSELNELHWHLNKKEIPESPLAKFSSSNHIPLNRKYNDLIEEDITESSTTNLYPKIEDNVHVPKYEPNVKDPSVKELNVKEPSVKGLNVKDTTSSIRRDAFAYAYRNPKHTPRYMISRLEIPESASQLKTPSRSYKCWFFLILLFLSPFLPWFINFFVPMTTEDVRFCDTSFNNIKYVSSDGSVVDYNCVSCPSNGRCVDGKLVACDEGYKINSTPASLFQPYKAECVLDMKHLHRVEKYANLLKEIASKETGSMNCGSGGYDLLLFDNLKQKLRNKKLPSQDTPIDFDRYSGLALDELKHDDDIKIQKERTFDNKETIYVISKIPQYGLFCRIKLNNLIAIILVIFVIIIYINRKRWESYHVEKATKMVLNMMKQNRDIISEQWRESVMNEVEDDMTRIMLWKRVEDRLQENPLVRTRRLVDYKGLSSLHFDWDQVRSVPYFACRNPQF